MEPEGLDAHGKSKVMAEKAAWDYVKELPGESVSGALRAGCHSRGRPANHIS
jgi:hypothetical protein